MPELDGYGVLEELSATRISRHPRDRDVVVDELDMSLGASKWVRRTT